MNFDELRSAISDSWGIDTSSTEDEWSSNNPARGQCAVTALVVQDHLGGDLIRGVVNGESHYWNRLPDGTEVDLTIQQFGEDRTVGTVAPRERSYVLSFERTVVRYVTLLARIRERANA